MSFRFRLGLMVPLIIAAMAVGGPVGMAAFLAAAFLIATLS